MTKRRTRLPDAHTPGRHGWLSLLARGPARRRVAVPMALPDRPADAEAYVHMRYARTVPFHARGDWRLSRQRATLAFVAPVLDGLLVEPERPLSVLKLLNRAGFVPARDADLGILLTALYELSQQLGWRVHERHAALSHDELETRVRWPKEDFSIAPTKRAFLLRVRVAGEGMQIAAYQRDPLSASGEAAALV